MSLEDELNQSHGTRGTITTWINEWSAQLTPKDRRAWDAWLSDPHKPAATLFRVIRRHGFPHVESSFRSWVRNYRESLG